MKKSIAILAVATLGLTAAHAGFHLGIHIGLPLPVPAFVAPVPVVVAPAPMVVAPPMPAPLVEVVPACPTAGYIWVGGTWGWCNNRWIWTRGHWGPPVHWGFGYHGGYHGGHYAGYRGWHGHR